MSGLSGLTGLMGGGAGGAGDGENPLGALGGLGNLMGGLTDMFSKPEFTDAMNQLSQQFTPSETTGDNSNSNSNTNEANSSHTDECGSGCSHSSDGSESISTGSTEIPKPPPIFNNALFGDLAEEIGKTFNFEEMEKDGKPQNIGEALSRFMSGNNPAKLMELVGKFGGKLQDEVKKGNINPADLLKQTMSAAGGGQNLQNMMKNPQMQKHMKEMQAQQTQQAQSQTPNKSSTPTKDRLRAKLDKKNAENKE